MNKFDVAAIVWPAYTGDEPRTKMFWPQKNGEWETVAKKQIKGDYVWEKKPLWGYPNEADRYVMEGQIKAAVDHGVNVFIYDWYWYDKRPFLENCLNDGFLKADNNKEMQFYLMWANHDFNYVCDMRNSDDSTTSIWDGFVDRKEFEVICHRIIEKYFKQSNYYKIDGEPVFMIFQTENLIKGLGGINETNEAIEWFRNEVIKAGFKGLHLQVAAYMDNGNTKTGTTPELVHSLDYNSMTHYVFRNFVKMDADYMKVLENVKNEWDRIDKEYNLPYFPSISMGWDDNPRYKEYRPEIIKNSSPENFKQGLILAKEYLEKHKRHPLVVINSWNEWTETSYLQPEAEYGYGYLEAVKEVFKGEK